MLGGALERWSMCLLSKHFEQIVLVKGFCAFVAIPMLLAGEVVVALTPEVATYNVALPDVVSVSTSIVAARASVTHVAQ